MQGKITESEITKNSRFTKEESCSVAQLFSLLIEIDKSLAERKEVMGHEQKQRGPEAFKSFF